MSALAETIPMWLTVTLATIGAASVGAGIVLTAFWLLTDWKRERREGWEAERIRQMGLTEVEYVTLEMRPQPARWQ